MSRNTHDQGGRRIGVRPLQEVKPLEETLQKITDPWLKPRGEWLVKSLLQAPWNATRAFLQAATGRATLAMNDPLS